MTTSSMGFEKWAEVLRAVEFLSPQLSVEILRRHKISIPRMLIPFSEFPSTLYRARIIQRDSKEDITDPKTFSYPPACVTTSYQRANVPGFPVFYGALDGQTAFEEIRINGAPIRKGDTVFLSEWKVKKTSKATLAQLTLPTLKGESQLMSSITAKVFKEFKRICKGESEDFYREQLRSYVKATNLFLTGRYLQSGTIAHDILYNTPEVNGITIHGILYPSCSNDYRSANCAIHPKFADDHMELLRVRKLEFDEYRGKGAHSKGRYAASPVQGKLLWKSYYSELKIAQFTAGLLAYSEWPIDRVRGAKFILDGNEVDILAFTSARVDEIDLSNYTIPQDQEENYIKGATYTLTHRVNFKAQTAWLQDRDEMNFVHSLLIEIPLIAQTMEVPSAKVVKWSGTDN